MKKLSIWAKWDKLFYIYHTQNWEIFPHEH